MTAISLGPSPARRDALARRIRLLVAATITYNVIEAVLDYVPAAVGYVDDDLDLPPPDFADHIRTLTASTTKLTSSHHAHATLPARPALSGLKTDASPGAVAR